ERQRAEHFRRHTPVATPRLLGHSAAMRALQRDIATVAASDLAVLVTGETGVGKELVAQALHAQSDRADQAFVSINCAALPDTLVESELFGHVRGAFTGAVGDRQGKFEQAHQGTLFLDEVGELPLVTQAKLLRVLQSGQIQRLGLDRERTVDVRIIAATNQDLAAAVRAGRMRADFYHRLSVYPLQVPPLRAREGDVLVLAGYFLERTRSQFGLDGLRLEADAQAALLAHRWPGNVRELEHAVRRAVLHALRRPRTPGQLLGIVARDFVLTPSSIADSADAEPAAGLFDPKTPAPPAAGDRPGSAGAALPHAQLRIAADGEIEVAGSLFSGYLGQATPVGPWWPTGDLGRLDADGFLHVDGRKKHVLITAFGRNVAPEWVETALGNEAAIAQAVVLGDGQPFLSAVLWPVTPATSNAQLQAAIDAANLTLPDYAQIHHWCRGQAPFTSEFGMATANGRPRREVVRHVHASALGLEARGA
ncbi:sigma 54-interacting transcriptional regulator, partial [Comamonas aquatica]|uniref:sigma 54-interacting transcriptional regulator n=1 Tax=Comamonas aquatica TaxID=225991 RepID=UPI0018D427FE